MSKLELRNLAVLAYANGFTLWQYKHTENNLELSELEIELFGKASDLMAVGDVIFITMKGRTYMRCVDFVGPNKVTLQPVY